MKELKIIATYDHTSTVPGKIKVFHLDTTLREIFAKHPYDHCNTVLITKEFILEDNHNRGE